MAKVSMDGLRADMIKNYNQMFKDMKLNGDSKYDHFMEELRFNIAVFCCCSDDREDNFSDMAEEATNKLIK